MRNSCAASFFGLLIGWRVVISQSPCVLRFRWIDYSKLRAGMQELFVSCFFRPIRLNNIGGQFFVSPAASQNILEPLRLTTATTPYFVAKLILYTGLAPRLAHRRSDLDCRESVYIYKVLHNLKILFPAHLQCC